MPAPKPKKPPHYTVSSLALVWDVDQAQVSRWKAAGMPFTKAGRISLAAATRWVREYERRERPKGNASEAMDRRAIAESELAELRLARERGDVVPAAEVLAASEEEQARVVGCLTQTPSGVAPHLAATYGLPLRTAAAIARDVIDHARELLASDDEDNDTADAA
jgi:phage terminase Nu1 subunit (DNA packaging protein)